MEKAKEKKEDKGAVKKEPDTGQKGKEETKAPVRRTNLIVLIQADKPCDGKKNSLFLRLSANGNKQSDIPAKRIVGLEDTFVVMTSLPPGMNIALLQMGKSSNNYPTKIAPNNHIVDLDNDTLLHIKWGKQLHRLSLSPGKQLIFILQAPSHSDHVAIQGSIRQLGSWKDDDLQQYCMHIEGTGSLVAVPVEKKNKSIAFKMVLHGDSGMEWERPLHKNKVADLVGTSATDILVSRWNDPNVYKTEVEISTMGYRVKQSDEDMLAIIKGTADMIKKIDARAAEEATAEARAHKGNIGLDGEAAGGADLPTPTEDNEDNDDTGTTTLYDDIHSNCGYDLTTREEDPESIPTEQGGVSDDVLPGGQGALTGQLSQEEGVVDEVLDYQVEANLDMAYEAHVGDDDKANLKGTEQIEPVAEEDNGTEPGTEEANYDLPNPKPGSQSCYDLPPPHNGERTHAAAVTRSDTLPNSSTYHEDRDDPLETGSAQEDGGAAGDECCSMATGTESAVVYTEDSATMTAESEVSSVTKKKKKRGLSLKRSTQALRKAFSGLSLKKHPKKKDFPLQDVHGT